MDLESMGNFNNKAKIIFAFIFLFTASVFLAMWQEKEGNVSNCDNENDEAFLIMDNIRIDEDGGENIQSEIVKYNKDGAYVESRELLSNSQYDTCKMAENGNIIFAYREYDYGIRIYDSMLNIISNQHVDYKLSFLSTYIDIAPLDDGTFYLVGKAPSGNGENRYKIYKFSETGVKQNEFDLFEYQDSLYANVKMVISSDDGIVVSALDCQLFKVREDGDIVWNTSVDYTQNDNYECAVKYMLADADSSIYLILGITDESEIVKELLVKYDLNGEEKWRSEIGEDQDYIVSSVDLKIDLDGNIVVVGTQLSSFLGSQTPYGDAVIEKYSPEGNMIWSVKHDMIEECAIANESEEDEDDACGCF